MMKKRVLWQLFTEGGRAYERNVIRLAEQYLPAGFTLTHTTGYWGGNVEKSLLLEALGTCAKDIRRLAQAVKIANRQEAVLITWQPMDFQLL